jgi:glycosyltransferase involved in cell wall biosynthesis
MTWLRNIENLPLNLKSPFRFLKLLLESAAEVHSITTWETDKIPEYWGSVFKQLKVQQCFVPSHWNVSTYKKEKIEACLLPHYIDCDKQKNTQKVKLPNIDGKYVFFTMSQWGPRKGFDALLRAYFSEFKTQKDVVLIIKTYVDNTSLNGKTAAEQITEEIKQIKSKIFVDEQNSTPQCSVCVVVDVLPKEKINYLYDISDCFVLATRGEGFGLTIAEAVSFEKPVIVPNKGGHIDYLEPNDLLFECHLSPCYGMPNYECGSNYYEPNILSLMNKMRYAFEHREKACTTLWKREYKECFSRKPCSKKSQLEHKTTPFHNQQP